MKLMVHYRNQLDCVIPNMQYVSRAYYDLRYSTRCIALQVVITTAVTELVFNLFNIYKTDYLSYLK